MYQWKQYSGNEWGYDRIYVENANGLEAASLRDLHGQVAQDTGQKFTLIFVPTGSTVQVSVGRFGPKANVEIMTTTCNGAFYQHSHAWAGRDKQCDGDAHPDNGEPDPHAHLRVSPVGQLSQAKYTYDGDGNLVKSEVTSW